MKIKVTKIRRKSFCCILLKQLQKFVGGQDDLLSQYIQSYR